MNIEKGAKVITCILTKGTSKKVAEALFEKGNNRFYFANARGFGVLDQLETKSGLPKEEEKEVFSVTAKDASEAEELFEFIYELANIGEPHGGLMYMSDLIGATQFMLQDL
ncbi:MAG: hypothetical protein HOO06_11895 [Bdellovibrionaceae bacterium]|jgi:nitrogen regulatory protein PII|nr:hypothetical protein [Pseudobdellovibrionaceae bacterium]